MNAPERQNAILDVLCRERQEALKNLAERFCVCRNTIQRDIEVLSCTCPIKTVRGKYGGGVYMEKWYQPHRNCLSNEQMALLRRLLADLTGKDKQILQSVLSQFGPGSLL